MKPELFKYLIQCKELYDDEIFLSKFNSNPNNVDNLPISDIDVLNNINVLKNEVKNCYKCSLSASRTNTVFGYGDFNASLLIVGEAPGQQEDLSGNPFVGRAGKLLDKMLTAINRSLWVKLFHPSHY